MHADPIWDMLNRLKTATMAKKNSANVAYSNVNCSILDVLKKTKYISWYTVEKWDKFKTLNVVFSSDRWVLNLKRISKPWCRIFIRWRDLRPLARWYWIYIISTSQWIMPWFEAFSKWLWWEVIWQVS